VTTSVTDLPQVEASRGLRHRLAAIEQGTLVMGLSAVLVVVGAVTTRGFTTFGNFRVVLLLSSALGIVSVGQSIVILGKGVDLSVAVVAALAAQGSVELFTKRGFSEGEAVAFVLAMGLGMGLFNGWLVAYAEVPALFATLGTMALFNGVVRVNLLPTHLYQLPPNSDIVRWMGSGDVLGIPAPIVLAGIVFIGAWLFVTYTSPGRLIRAMGDNPEAARLMGAPVRPLIVTTYVISSVLAAIAGLIILGKDGGYSTIYGAGQDILFESITIVVIGGVSLSGGKGSIFGVFSGAAFVAIIVNLLTLNNLSLLTRNFTRGLVLIVAVAVDAWLHPRDEETAKTEDL
jgi:ribose transport system permease protein